MAHSLYDDDVATVLAASGLSLVKGTNLFTGKLRSAVSPTLIPAKAVFVLETGGPEPINYIDGATTPQLREPTVQIMVRSDPREWAVGRTLANGCWDAIHDTPPTGYIGARCLQPTPLHIGEDDAGNHLWSINVRLIISE